YTKPMPSEQSEKLHSKLLDALIYDNIPFNLVKNPYFQAFFNKAVPNYQLPSSDILQENIVDLSANRYKALFIISQTKEIFARNGFQMLSAIACVTDNLPVM
ncbi:11371_t:CDS:2, partial [Cetraspora pellucida]